MKEKVLNKIKFKFQSSINQLNHQSKMNSQTSNRELKELPYNVSRSDIKVMYNHLSTRAVTTCLDIIILEYSKAHNLPFARYNKLPRPVWVEFIKIQGFPINYKHQNDWLEEKTF